MIRVESKGQWGSMDALLNALPAEIRKAISEATDEIGKEIEKTMKGHIQSNDLGWKPLADSTIKKKGHDQPLIDTGELLDSIKYEKIDDGSGFVGAHKMKGDFNVALALEMGAPAHKMPARPFLEPTAKEKENYVAETYEKALGSAVDKKMGK